VIKAGLRKNDCGVEHGCNNAAYDRPKNTQAK